MNQGILEIICCLILEESGVTRIARGISHRSLTDLPDLDSTSSG